MRMQLLISTALILLLGLGYMSITDSFNNDSTTRQDYHYQLPADSARLKTVASLSSYGSISDQPLFIKNRKLNKPKTVQKIIRKKPVDQTLRVKALGVALTGDGVIAVIKDLKDGKIVRMKIDDELKGWALKSVAEGQFSFRKDDLEITVKFKN